MMNAQAKFSAGISRHRCTKFSGVTPAVAGRESGLACVWAPGLQDTE